MQYFVTIYIHPMSLNASEILGIPHAFLGLTKDKSPDELDSQSNIELEKYFNPQSL